MSTTGRYVCFVARNNQIAIASYSRKEIFNAPTKFDVNICENPDGRMVLFVSIEYTRRRYPALTTWPIVARTEILKCT